MSELWFIADTIVNNSHLSNGLPTQSTPKLLVTVKAKHAV